MKVKDLRQLLYNYEEKFGNIEVYKMTIGYEPLTNSDVVCIGNKIII